MASSIYVFFFMRLLFLLSLLHLILTHSPPFMKPLCHDDESSALLQFKEGFVIDKSASPYYPLACQKVASWALEGDKSDCCSWDGVECDQDTGHVIGLDLSNSCLFGSINSTSSLFRLVHLKRLNLAYNHFNYSPIPPQVRNLSELTYLNLTASMFSGQIPSEISQLSHLTSLHLCYNYDWYPGKHLLELRKPVLTSLIGNLTHLQELGLGGVSIFFEIPTILTSFSSLTSLNLKDCELHGLFPIGIFKLPNLQLLNVGYNEGLNGYLPDFTWSSPLKTLRLPATGFSGELPPSIGNLSYLNALDVSGCNFTGFIPSSLGNLTNLTFLGLSNNTFKGEVPSSIGNLNRLSFLDLSINHFTGEIPVEILNLTELTFLALGGNELRGRIPNSVFNLTNLQYLDLVVNNFSGTVEFDEFVKLKHLTVLYLSYNQFSLLFKEPNANATFPKFQSLALSSCNLSKFPDFLRNQDELEYLELAENNLRGQVPEWMSNIGKASLEVICLSNNFLTGFAQNPIFLPWTRLSIFHLRSNLLQGLLPIPPASTLQYYVSNNSFSGDVPTLFCNLSYLQVLDLASNNLSGSLPQCLDNFGASLSVLDLRRNKFEGSIPQSWVKGSQLKIIIFGQNKFQGQLPMSLVNCTMLKVLDLSNNLFNDRFPSWLENLPNLEVLILRSNKFKGPIKISKSEYMFPNLQVIDLSYNRFVGKLPLELFRNLKLRKSETTYRHLTYIHVYSNYTFFFKTYVRSYQMSYGYDYTMTMTNKGTDQFYEKVLESFIAVDMSSNRFSGEIPNSIENLRGCHLLNLSNNILTGHIPPSLGSHVELEALDLSYNKLSGEIPSELTQLNFLGFFNVSHNNITGLIPQGRHFDTFDNSSFEGNPRLCGRPLTKKCEDSEELPSPPSIFESSQDFGSPFEFGWKIVVIGYGFGFVIGVIIGRIVIARKHDWLMKTLRIRPLSRRRHRN